MEATLRVGVCSGCARRCLCVETGAGDEMRLVCPRCSAAQGREVVVGGCACGARFASSEDAHAHDCPLEGREPSLEVTLVALGEVAAEDLADFAGQPLLVFTGSVESVRAAAPLFRRPVRLAEVAP